MSDAVTTVHRVRCDDIAPQRWRNGGGWTRELLAWPDASDWRLRVSVADIDSDGPFSSFPGVNRFFAVLQGAGVALTIDGVAQRVTCDDPAVQFSGAATTSCRLLDGSTRDLNLMVRGSAGSMRRVAIGEAWRPSAAPCGLFGVAQGECRADDRVLPVAAFSLLWFERAPAMLTSDASGWWISA